MSVPPTPARASASGSADRNAAPTSSAAARSCAARCARLNLKFEDSEVLGLFKYDNMDEMLANLGSGGVGEGQLAQKLAEARQEPEHPLARKRTDLPLSSPTSGIKVLGVGDLLTRMGGCCSPIPGDEIVGFVTRSRGVTVHKRTCPSVLHEDEPERFVQVEWGQAKELFPVRGNHAGLRPRRPSA